MQASSNGEDIGLPSRECGFDSRRLLQRALCCFAHDISPPYPHGAGHRDRPAGIRNDIAGYSSGN